MGIQPPKETDELFKKSVKDIMGNEVVTGTVLDTDSTSISSPVMSPARKAAVEMSARKTIETTCSNIVPLQQKTPQPQISVGRPTAIFESVIAIGVILGYSPGNTVWNRKEGRLSVTAPNYQTVSEPLTDFQAGKFVQIFSAVSQTRGMNSIAAIVKQMLVI
jgi:hypothetical protein